LSRRPRRRPLLAVLFIREVPLRRNAEPVGNGYPDGHESERQAFG
jgi:hypothetical protein